MARIKKISVLVVGLLLLLSSVVIAQDEAPDTAVDDAVVESTMDMNTPA